MKPSQKLPLELAAEVDRLAAGLQRGELDAAECERLNALLLDYPAARKRYIRGLAIIGDLEWGAEAPMNEPQTPPAPPAEQPAPLNPISFPSMSGHSWLIGFTIVAVVAALCAYQFGSHAPSAIAPATSRGESNLAAVKKVKLESGSVELAVDKVGTVVVAGPADFELLGPMRARLNSGRIRMRVTEKTGHGFVVETPDGDITDLGTEFGVRVESGKKTVLAVFEGAVDLKVAGQTTATPRIERLLGGDGVIFSNRGQMDRLTSIMTSAGAMFEVCGDLSLPNREDPLIVDAYDNLPAKSTKRYYEIMSKGMGEDVLMYVDRKLHNWNGIASYTGMPKYLVGADYVKTFCDDRHLENNDGFELTVVLSRPAKLYVLYDRRLTVPDWLRNSFRQTEDRIGMDFGGARAPGKVTTSLVQTGEGPGQSIDYEFTVWEQNVDKPGPVTLGAMGSYRRYKRRMMYGVVAVEMPAPTTNDTDQQVLGTANPGDSEFDRATVRDSRLAVTPNESTVPFTKRADALRHLHL